MLSVENIFFVSYWVFSMVCFLPIINSIFLILNYHLDICIFYSLIISLVFSLTICFFSIENLLNNSKSQHGNSELINTQPEHDERHTPSPIDDRHERTGSVKFADQSDEGKEVRKTLFLIHKKKYL